MQSNGSHPSVTICVLTYGDHAPLARRCLESIQKNTDRSLYRLFVGANAVGPETQRFLEEMSASGAIDRLISSPVNINKCPMMRRLVADIDTEFIWWLDDDSHVALPGTLARWLDIARSSAPRIVHWGHQFFFGHEQDFSYGVDVCSFVEKAPWYRRKPPPSWKPGGKGEYDFEGRGTGDGRWFFITGGCWLIRTEVIRALDWPDPNLIKRNDDVFLCEAIRQQGWELMDVGSLGVMINAEPRRGEGEDLSTMEQQMAGRVARCSPREQIHPDPLEPSSHIRSGKGCVFLPTFRDTDLLEENFGNRAELSAEIEFYVFDDNYDSSESDRIKKLCQQNQWHYRKTGRPRHGDFDQDQNDRSGWNQFIWQTFTMLGASYEFVVKVDTDTLLIDPTWHEEIARLLVDRTAFAGTAEYRPTKDVQSFWNLAKASGYSFVPGKHVMHVQGGISAYSRKALRKIRQMGFLEGRHVFFGEDCYMSYCCHVLGIPFLKTKTVGSWWHPYRPPLETLKDRKAIHPLTRSEWQRFEQDKAAKRAAPASVPHLAVWT